MAFFADLLREFKFAPVEAAKRRLEELAGGYPEEDTSVSNPPPVSDEVLTGWDNANGGWMGAEIPAQEPTVDPYYPEEPAPTDWGASIPEDFYIPDFGFGGFTGIDEPPTGTSFSERLRQWRELNRPGTDPYADVRFAGDSWAPPTEGTIQPLAGVPSGDEFQQWDSLPTPGEETAFAGPPSPEYNPEVERWRMALDDQSWPGNYSLNLDWSLPVTTTDFFGNPRTYDMSADGGSIEERPNPVMGKNGDSSAWAMDRLGDALHVGNVIQTAPKEVGSSIFPATIDLLSGQGLSDAAGGGWKGSLLEQAQRFTPAGRLVGGLSDLAETVGVYKPGTGYDDAASLVDIARQSDNPWDYAERLTEKNSRRPFIEQVLGEAVNPINVFGSGLIADDASRFLKGIDTAVDWGQGGPIFNAAISGAGRGVGAVREALQNPALKDALVAGERGSGPNMFGWIPFGGADDPSSLGMVDDVLSEANPPRLPNSNSVTVEPPISQLAPAAVAPELTPRGPLDIAATIKQPDELAAQGLDDIRMTVAPRFELPPPDEATAVALENVNLYRKSRGDIGIETTNLKRWQAEAQEATYKRLLDEGKSPYEATVQARAEIAGRLRSTPYAPIPFTPEQKDALILRARMMRDQGGLNTFQVVDELTDIFKKLDEGVAIAPAEANLLEYIATGVKNGDAGFKTPDVPDTDTLPMFGADTDFSASISKMNEPDVAKRIIGSAEPQPNLFRLGSEEAGSPYRVEGDTNPTGQSFAPPRIPTNEAQIPLTLEYGAEGFAPGVTPNTTGITSADMPRIPDNEQQLPAVLPYGTDSFVPAVAPNVTDITSADMPRIPTNEAQLEMVQPYGVESYMPMVTPGKPFEFTSTPGSAAPTELAMKAAETTNTWRELNYPDFDKIGDKAGASIVSRALNGGDLPSRVANTLTLRGRELTQALENAGITREDAVRVAKAEIGRYMDKRFATAMFAGDTDGAARQAYAALNLGDFRDSAFTNAVKSYNLQPNDAVDLNAALIKDRDAGIIPPSVRGVDQLRADYPELYKSFVARNSSDAGKIPAALSAIEDFSAKMKNLKFGFLDLNAIASNVLPAAQGGLPAMAAKMLNSMVGSMTGKQVIDFGEMYASGKLADPSLIGLNMRPKGMELTPDAGTPLALVAKAADWANAKKVGSVLGKADQGLMKYNEALSDIQYNKLLGGQRKAIYEGNLVLLKLIGKDISDPAVQRVAAEMANSLTSAANLATRNGRRAVENTSLTSASFLRAQGELLKQLGNVVTGGATPGELSKVVKLTPERIVAASTLGTILAGAWGAAQLADGDLNINPLDSDFGWLTVPNGQGGYMKVQVFPQRQLARTIASSFNLISGQDPKEVGQAWAEFFMGRAAPVPQAVMNLFDYGFDPSKGQYAFGDWGDSMTTMEKLLTIGPFPTGTKRIIDTATGKTSIASLIGQIQGAQTYDESPLDVAIRDDISQGYLAEGTKYGDFKNDPLLKRQFNNRHPGVWEDSGDPSEYQQIREEKRAITEGFEANRVAVGKWRDDLREKSAETSGVFRQLDLESGQVDSPKEQMVFDYNETFEKAKSPGTGIIDFDKLDKLQTEFWDKYDTPAERKYIIDYQLAGATNAAEKLYIKDQARLRGYDPDTGKRLTYSNGKPLPDYYELKENNQYVSTVLPNKMLGDMMDRFEEWRGRTNPPGERSAQLAQYISTVEKKAPDGKPWDAARLTDLNNYGKESKETLEFQAYKNTYKAWLSWNDQNAYWSEIQRLHAESKPNGMYSGK